MSDRAGAGCAATWPTGSGRPHDAPDNESRMARLATESQDDAIPHSPTTAFCRDGDTRACRSVRRHDGHSCHRVVMPPTPTRPVSRPIRAGTVTNPVHTSPLASHRDPPAHRSGPDRTGPDRTGPDRTGRLMPDRTIGSVNKRVTYEQNSAGHRWAATRSTSPASSGRACVPPATFPAESGSPRADPRRSPRPGRPRGWSRNPPGRADAPSIEHTHENQHPVRSPTPMP